MPVENGTDYSADIIIAGAGLAGATLAALLARRGLACLVLDNRPRQPDSKERTDPRSLAMTLASANILRHAHAWSLLPAERIGHFRQMQVWDAPGHGEITFDSADICEATLGYIIEQALLESTLLDVCAGLADCQLQFGAGITDIRAETDAVQVVLDSGQLLSGRLLVGADGANSTVRDLAGIACHRHDYRQQALAGVVETELPHADVARQVFLPDGPLAFLPQAAGNRSGFVWSTAPAHAQTLLTLDEAGFNEALAEAFAWRLGAVRQCFSRVAFPLQHARAASYCRPRLALIGDAAHVVHPLAGQGANLGLLDAAVLAEVILQAIQKQRDPGSYPVLRRYERWRKGENLLMLKTLQGLKELFAARAPALRLLRNSGLDLADMLTPLKHAIMRRAMGLSGDLPDFARRPV